MVWTRLRVMPTFAGRRSIPVEGDYLSGGPAPVGLRACARWKNCCRETPRTSLPHSGRHRGTRTVLSGAGRRGRINLGVPTTYLVLGRRVVGPVACVVDPAHEVPESVPDSGDGRVVERPFALVIGQTHLCGLREVAPALEEDQQIAPHEIEVRTPGLQVGPEEALGIS